MCDPDLERLLELREEQSLTDPSVDCKTLSLADKERRFREALNVYSWVSKEWDSDPLNSVTIAEDVNHFVAYKYFHYRLWPPTVLEVDSNSLNDRAAFGTEKAWSALFYPEPAHANCNCDIEHKSLVPNVTGSGRIRSPTGPKNKDTTTANLHIRLEIL